jgi:glutaconate CoA-transferase subunit A
MSKLCTMREAVERHVADGASLYITGFTHLIDFAAAHEIIRRGRRGLTLIRMTPDLVYDQMVAAGCASRLVFSYIGNPGVGPLYVVKRAIESGAVEVGEYTHGSLVAALRAGASGAPFAAAPALSGTDLVGRNDGIATVRDPFGGGEVAVVGPVRPDVAIVHVQQADASGNAQVWGAAGEIADAAFASRRVVVTAERIVGEGVIRADPSRTILPAWAVDAVVEAPFASHPSYAQGMYARDNAFYRDWARISRDGAQLDAYLDEWVHGVESREEYTERLGQRAEELRSIGEALSPSVNYGDNAAIAAVQDRGAA